MANFPTEFDDIIIGDKSDNIIDALAGNDFISGGLGNDTLLGNTGNDILVGGDGLDILNGGKGIDTVHYSGYDGPVTVDLSKGLGYANALGKDADGDTLIGIDNIVGSAFGDKLTGNAKANRIDGGAGIDQLFGMGGNDRLFGGDNDDGLEGGAGADRIDGGTNGDLTGDMAIYGESGVGVEVDLATGLGHGGDAEGDVLVRIESLLGSEHADKLTGNGGNNTLMGSLGNDVISGGGGNDVLVGGEGDDEVSGGLGDDQLLGDAGADTYDGGGGRDMVHYSQSKEGVTVNLTTGKASGGDAEGDTLVDIEFVAGSKTGANTLTGDGGLNALGGGDGNDTLSGLGGKDILTGGGGKDVLLGGSGIDWLTGGTGRDAMTGGDGADHFFFNAIADSSAGAWDTITDFVSGSDKLTFTIDADPGTIGDQTALTFIGDSSFTVGKFGQTRAFVSKGNTFVEVEYTGDGVADMSIKLLGISGITADDFF